MRFQIGILSGVLMTMFAMERAGAAEAPDIHDFPCDLAVPPIADGSPAPGKRVQAVTAGWEGTEVHHLGYLPIDWTPAARLPVIVEYAGNGGFKNAYGDVSEGTVEGSNLGYGVTGGRGFIWICMPFVEADANGKRNAVKWWGDVAETKRYCIATVKDVCARLGGDPDRLILAGFSRGSIACNFIGLHDDEIAKLWRAFICHSHYDGVREGWPYAGADRASALERLKRLRDRPQWISHEGGTQATESYLRSTGVEGRWTFQALPFRNHTDSWVLRDLPIRKALRDWLAAVIGTDASAAAH